MGSSKIIDNKIHAPDIHVTIQEITCNPVEILLLFHLMTSQHKTHPNRFQPDICNNSSANHKGSRMDTDSVESVDDFESESDIDEEEEYNLEQTIACFREVYWHIQRYSQDLSESEKAEMMALRGNSSNDHLPGLRAAVPVEEQRHFYCGNGDIGKSVVSENPRCFKFLPEKWRNDSDFVIGFIAVNPKVFPELGEKWQSDEQVSCWTWFR